MNIEINRNALRAVSLFAARDKDVRYYLRSALLEVSGEEYRLVGTDGHAMAIYRGTCNDTACKTEFILPIDVVKKIKKSKMEFVTFESLGNGTFKLVDGETEYHGAAIDAKYPDYRSAFPRELSGEAAYYDPDILARFKRAEDCFGHVRSNLEIGFNGRGPAVIDIHEDCFTGCIMPWKQCDASLPKWVREQDESLKVAA